MTQLTPFADDAASMSIDKLTIENGTDRVAMYGSLDITRDQQGLIHARALLAIVQEAVQRLEGKKNLPASVPPAAKPTAVANPFS
jgi:hypothetical protein